MFAINVLRILRVNQQAMHQSAIKYRIYVLRGPKTESRQIEMSYIVKRRSGAAIQERAKK